MATHVVKFCRVAQLLRPSCNLAGSLRPVAAGRRALSENESGDTEPPNGDTRIQEDPYRGISSASFSQKVTDVLLAPVKESDVEIKPDGLIYLPEIKYRRILNQAFGPGGWALMPRSEALNFQNDIEGVQLITREYALYCYGRYVSQAMGEHTFFGKNNLQYGKACESAKSNALMRCCKDLGVASELWDPQVYVDALNHQRSSKNEFVYQSLDSLLQYISKWKQEHASDVWCENLRTKEKKKLWRRKDTKTPFSYPWRESQ